MKKENKEKECREESVAIERADMTEDTLNNAKPDTEEEMSAAIEENIVIEEKVKEPAEEEKLRDRLLRLQADFDNYRKRIARDYAEMVRSSNNCLIESLLPVLDHTEHALNAMKKSFENGENPYTAGFVLVQNELLKALGKYGLSPIDTYKKPFDANLHEAISTMRSNEADPDTVVAEIRKGYMLNDKVLRPSQVIVSIPPDTDN